MCPCLSIQLIWDTKDCIYVQLIESKIYDRLSPLFTSNINIGAFSQ